MEEGQNQMLDETYSSHVFFLLHTVRKEESAR